ncbi:MULTISPECIES: hypothetical protein [unclassified Roseateles]|uniref:hypothetical protein n=1 Tax=unclassified Roseateles TaxID=2626991 RepID=UPI0006F1DE1A|nr:MULTISPECIES: hypothetical protein [unclassified Roseateles]KQW46661.1 hypothetical protein ASC81_09795 [Pelomonas sp. Root405]KRA73713.1 hypothetical protein ASD88_09795 [Pelomonas sp. Root662]
MTTAKLELLEPANYIRLLKTELKDSDGKAVALRYIYDRADKKPAVVFVGDVGAGMVTLMKKQDSGLKVLIGRIAETEKAFLFEAGSQLTDKGLTVQLLDASIRKPVLRVKDLDAALQTLSSASGKGAAPSKDENALVDKAKKAFEGLKARKDVALKRGADNHKQRLNAAIKEYDDAVKDGSGKEAVEAVVGIGKVLDLIEREHDLKGEALEKRMKALKTQADGFKKPALHPKHTKAIGEVFDSVQKAVDAVEFLNLATQLAKLDAVDTLLDKASDLARVFRDQKSEHEALVKEIAQKDRATVLKTRKKDLELLEKAVKQLADKTPDTLLIADRYEPFTDLIELENKLLTFMRDALKPTTAVDLSTVTGRKSVYAYNDSSTWVMNPVVYRNGTSNSSMTSQQLDLLKKGQLKSNTTAGGSVLKVGFEGHVHIDGGSGGMAFVYQLDDQYKVTPIVVDTANSRGNGKDKNKYSWSTGGLDYFPPNARY